MKTHHKLQIAGLFALVSLISILSCPDSAFALGFALPDQDAFAMARGDAFVATANDPAAVYYNPAGISQLEGTVFSANVYSILYGSTYKGPAGEVNSKEQLAALPQVFSSMSLPYGFTFGLGTYSQYGLRMEWPDNSILSAAGQTGEIDLVTLNPVLAYKICSTLSIAAGPMLSYSEADFKLTPGFVDHFRGRDTDAGFNIGVLWHPWEQHSFGVTYRSPMDMNYEGHATLPPGPNSVPASANFHLPQQVVAGYSYRPTTNWNIETDATWSDWSSLQTVNIAPLPENFAFDWHPSWMASLGATRYFDNGWRLSAGYMYSENTVPNNTFNPLVPDSDRDIFSIGVGKSYKHFSWDLAYQLAWGPPRGVNNDGSYPFVNGTYEFLSHAVAFNVAYHF